MMSSMSPIGHMRKTRQVSRENYDNAERARAGKIGNL